MSDEIKVVYKNETFNDRAVRELASVEAQCMCRLQFGTCEKSECAGCGIHKRFTRCWDSMNDYDRSRLEARIGSYYHVYSAGPEAYMPYDKLKAWYLKWTLPFLAVLLLGLVFCAAGNASGWKPGEKFKGHTVPDRGGSCPKHEYCSPKVDECVLENLRHVNSYCYDYNMDGETDCSDHAVLFKLRWDRLYGSVAKCYIIRNCDKEIGFHHLLVMIDDPYKRRYIPVETWIVDGDYSKRCVHCAWGHVYALYHEYWCEDEYWIGGGVYCPR